MRKITEKQLKTILKKHWLWLEGKVRGVQADLSEVDLCGRNLRYTNLRWANLYGADLSLADLRGADLRGARLYGANLYMADIRGTFFDEMALPIACPEKGSFTAFKKANGYIVELLIPEDAKRCSATTRKCRCDKAKVVSITYMNGDDSGLSEIASNHDNNFIYKIGEYVEVEDFDKNRWNECTKGIHFFITRQEAVNY